MGVQGACLVLGVVVEGGQTGLCAGKLKHVAEQQDAGILDFAAHLAVGEVFAAH